MKQYEIDHNNLIRKRAPECSVLLKYDGSFPIDKPCRVALFGNGVRHTIMGGTGSGSVNVRENITVEKAFIAEGFDIVSKQWLDDYDLEKEKAHKQFLNDIKQSAKKNKRMAMVEAVGRYQLESEYDSDLMFDCDLAIYVLSRVSGEGADRNFVKGDILLTDTEIRDILSLNRLYKKFILVLNVAGPIDLYYVKNVKNILLLGQLGSQTGLILTDIILGKSYPSGKLTSTWAEVDKYCHLGNFGDKDDTYYKEDIFVGYRYFDTYKIASIFPFGYGLSYTEFIIYDVKINQNNLQFDIIFKIKNVGQQIGKEIVQLYVSLPNGELRKAYQELVGFYKTSELKPQQIEQGHIYFDLANFSSFDEKTKQYILEPGNYIFRLGESSVNTNIVSTYVLKDKIIYFDTDKVNPQKRIILDEVKIMKNSDLAHASSGNYRSTNSLAQMIGTAPSKVAGAAGETTGFLKYDPLVMADGPAGLRIEKYYFELDGLSYAYQNSFNLSQNSFELAPSVVKTIFNSTRKKPPKKIDIKEHFATSIPVAACLSQSWNLALAEKIGNLIGEEMELFDIDLWLAPALNIHRDIRCGRNFEYFSEDPLISGLFAASLTNGVQSHKGKGTVIKHFATNNQETYRCNNSSWVSERALREIYLKGFSIAIKLSNPKCIMSSYNLLNGTHTSESKWLLNYFLRDELNYEGVVMSDWLIETMSEKNSKYPPADYIKSINAGNDLIMPGGVKVYKEILRGLRQNLIDKEQIMVNVSRIINLIKEVNK